MSRDLDEHRPGGARWGMDLVGLCALREGVTVVVACNYFFQMADGKGPDSVAWQSVLRSSSSHTSKTSSASLKMVTHCQEHQTHGDSR